MANLPSQQTLSSRFSEAPCGKKTLTGLIKTVKKLGPSGIADVAAAAIGAGLEPDMKETNGTPQLIPRGDNPIRGFYISLVELSPHQSPRLLIG